MADLKSRLFNLLFRCGQYTLRNRFLYYCGTPVRWVYYLYSGWFLGVDIKLHTNIGPGFTIYHGARGSVISPSAVIGHNVSIRQNTTIGAKGFDSAEKSPVIKDNVTIGPNVCIIGNITIGEGAVIGAGAVVVKDVPPHTVVGGNPAKVIKSINMLKTGG